LGHGTRALGVLPADWKATAIMFRKFLAPLRAGTRPDAERRQFRSYTLVIGIFVGLLLVDLLTSWAAIGVVNSARAFSTGEGRYSKAQKIAVIALHGYAHSEREVDYARFLEAIKVPLGDKLARTALEKPAVNNDAAVRGLLAGNNHADDVDGMIRLFRWFSWWKPFAAAVTDWRTADDLMQQIIAEALAFHRQVIAGPVARDKRRAFLDRVDALDARMTRLENTFSTHMGEAARAATRVVVAGIALITTALWVIGILFATRLFRAQIALDRQLFRSERRFRDFAEIASDWFWETDTENRLSYMSESFLKFVGVTPEEAMGSDASEIVRNSVMSERHLQIHTEAIAARKAFRSIHLRVAGPDGQTRYWSISGKPNFNAKGVYKGYRGITNDITAHVQDRDALRAARDRAESANRAKSEFLANMSHELRTPLNAILGFSEVISAQHFGRDAIDRYAGYARDIHASGSHLLAIIEDIIDLSKIEAGHSTTDESVAAVSEIAAQVRTLMGSRFDQAGIEFRIEFTEPGTLIRADRRKLTQVLVNLLSNAAKFTPKGGKVILGAARNPDGSFAFAVSDTGIGIAKESIPTVLAPFGQIESAFSRKHHGTGLGLPLSKALVEMHGGTLALESTLGLGTTVIVTLPAERVVEAISAKSA
jgi:PAS domain S-box-containing protein